MSRLPRQKRILIETLEPRLLFSATADIAVFDDGNSDALQLSEAAAKLDLVAVYMPSPDPLAESDAVLLTSAAEPSSPITTTLVFVDTAVENHEALVEDIRQQHQTGSIEIIYLDADTDGVAQITEKLTRFSQLDSLHIISHGAPGSIALGSALLSTNNLFNYEDELTAWRAALGEDADILIYGCDVAATTEGQQLIAQIAALTDADVAASDDATGHSSLQGDWELEFAVGDIEHNVLVSAAVQDTWANVLASNHYINIQGGNSTQQVSSTIAVGQSFLFDSPDPTYTVNQIGVQLRLESGAANQDITIQLLDGGWNDASPLATQTINSSQLSESFGWKTFNFGDVTLNKNQTYILKITTTNADGKVFIAYRSDAWNNAEMIVNGTGNSSADLNFLLSYNDGNNQAPVNTVPGPQSTNQNTPLIFSALYGNQIQISDPDAFPNDVQITLNSPMGRLTLAQTTGLTFSAGNNDGSYSHITFRGAVDAVNAALATITYTPFNGVTGDDTFSITTKDLGLNGVEVADFFTITINDVNDAPTISITETEYSVNEQTLLDLHGTGIVVNDSDGDLLTVTFEVSNSYSELTATVGATGVIVLSGNNTETLILTGTSTQLNNLLAGNNGGVLTYRPGGDTPVASVVLTITVDDGELTASDATTINITAINDAPLNTVPHDVQVIDEDEQLEFSFANGNQIQISDPDAALGDLEVSLSVTNGVLTLGSIIGLDFSSGDGTGNSEMVFRGTLADINTALATITFTPTANYHGAAMLSITTNDLGNTGSGGALTDSDTINITINPVNDAPIVAIDLVDQATDEGDEFSYTFPLGTFTDVDGDSLTYSATLANNGPLPAWLLFDPVSRTFSGIADDGDVGTISVRVTATDGDGLSISDTFDITVNNVNDPPFLLYPIVDQAATEGVLFSFTFEADTFGDGDLDANFSYTAEMQDGSSLPSWLNFDAGTRTFSGTPGNNDVGTISIRLIVDDGTGATASDIFDIVVANINDAPAGTDKTISLDEDSSYTLSTADFGFSDTNDDPANTFLAVKIASLPTAGSLTLNGVAVTLNQFIVVADINAGRLVFTPAANAHGVGYSSFTFQVQDNGGTANGGLDLDPTANTITFDVTSVNDAPAGTDNTISLNEDGSHTLTAADFGFTDSNDSPANSLMAVKIASLPTAGSLTLNGVAVTLNQFIVVADINAGRLVFTPAANAHGVGYSSFTFQVQDNGGTANSGVDLDPTANTITFDVTSVNDAPAGTDNTISLNEDGSHTLTVADFGFTDANDSPANSLMVVKIASLPTAGSLTLNGVAVTLNQFIVVADINAGRLVFTPAANAHGVGYSSFTFQVQDNGGTANGGVDLDPTANTITFDVTSVNDAPAGTDNTISLNEDGSHTLTVADFGFTDSNDSPANSLMAVKIASLPTAGSLTLNGVAVTLNQFIVVADINAGRLVFTPAANAHGVGYSSFTFQVQDNGGTANGGVDLDPTANTITFDVTSVNDAPAGTDNTISLNEDGSHTLTAADFGFTDANDSPANSLMAVKIASLPTAGSLTLNGVAVTLNQFIVVADINAGRLVFTPAANAHGVGYSSFTFQVQDNGGTANGGVDLDPTANTITFDVTSVNDAPAGTDNTISLNEDGSHTLTVADFGFTDANDSPANSLMAVKIASLPTAGSLTLNGTAIAVDDFILVADINAGRLVFTPAANAHGVGYSSFTFQVQDNGGTANGGVDLDPIANTITFDVTSVNDAPAGTDNTISLNEDGSHTLTAADFGFTDANDSPENSLMTVKIASLPTAGSLTLNGTAIAVDDFILVADINAGRLVFTPAANAHGVDYSSFTFQVQDNGGTANGGVDLDPTANTITFDVTAVNDAPTVANPILDQNATEGSLFTFQFDSDVFEDVDVGDTLSYSVLLSNGDALPSWLSFDAATRTFSGTPANGDVGVLTIVVTATDTSNAFVSDTFILTVANENDAPIVVNPIFDQNATEGSLFTFQFDSDVFDDPDVGDTLAYSVQLSNGNALPTWLSFDATTRTFSGTPANGDVGILTIVVTATDTGNATVSDTFTLTVANVNDAPTVANPISGQNATEKSLFTFQFGSDVFEDVDVGDTLSYSVLLSNGDALPSWLNFDAATRTFSGTPANGDVGVLTIVVTATDTSNASVSDTFTLTVVNVNDAPTVVNPILDQNATEGSLFTFQFDSDVFEDVDVGDTLSYSVLLSNGDALPSWLSFDAATRTFSGTPANDDVGVLTIVVTATDTSNAFVSDTFILTVANENDAPIVVNPILDQNATEGVLFAFQFGSDVFDDPDVGDTLSYSVLLSNGDALPSWLSFDAATRTFSGTPANDDVGVLTIVVTATDTSNASVSDTFTLTIANVNDAPTVANPILDQQATENIAFNFQFGANTFSDIDAGDVLTYTAHLSNGAPLPAWLSFDAATRTFSGTPANGDVGILTIVVTATDTGNATVSDTFTLTVANVNDVPTVANPILDQQATENIAFNFQFGVNTFSDIDAGDVLTYTAHLSSGAPLPAWLSFDAATRTFSGTPANGDVGALTIVVTATDTGNATASDTFTLTVANVNDVPTVANPILDQQATENIAFNFQFGANTFSDIDTGDVLTYTAHLSNGAPLPAWLSFDAATRTFSGTPANGDVGILTIVVTATDTSNASASDTFTLTVANVNDVPAVANPILDQQATENIAFNFQFGANTFSDIDTGDVLTYTAHLSNGAPLPAWLSFDAATRTFSGTPANGDVGALTIVVTATDTNNATASDTFTLTVANVNDAPTVANPILDQQATENIAFNFQFGVNTFSDIDAGDVLTYTAHLSSGAPLPAWLSFDAATRTFSGTPANGDVGILTIVVTATDTGNATVSDTFTLTIANVNDAPTVANPILDQRATENIAFNFQFGANTFSDIDAGDVLTYTAHLSNGAPLPAWLSFDAATRIFSGTPANGDVDVLNIIVTATDTSNATESDTFTLIIANESVVTPPVVTPPETTPPTRPDPVIPPIVVPPDTELPIPTPPSGETALPPATVEPDAPVLVPESSLLIHEEANNSIYDVSKDKSARDYERAIEVIDRNVLPLSTLTASASLVSLIEPDAGFAPWEAAELDSEVRRIRAQMDEALDEEHNRKAVIAGISFSLTTGLLIWSLRASSLLLTMISMLPLWRGLDPLPILDEVNKRKKELEQQRKDRKHEDKNAKEVGYLFDHAQHKNKNS